MSLKKLKPLKLGEMLVKAGAIDKTQLDAALSYQQRWGGQLGDILVRLGCVDEETLLEVLADQLKLTRIDLESLTISAQVLATVPAEKAREYGVLPVDRIVMNGTVWLLVAMTDPTNLLVIDALQFMAGCQVRPVLAAKSALLVAIDRYYACREGAETALREYPPVEVVASADNDSPQIASSSVADGQQRPEGLEEKFQFLVRLLMDKGLLSLREFDRIK
jgi:MshEN domain